MYDRADIKPIFKNTENKTLKFSAHKMGRNLIGRKKILLLYIILKNVNPDNNFSITNVNSKPAVGSFASVRVLNFIQQPGSYWDRTSLLPLKGMEPTQR